MTADLTFDFATLPAPQRYKLMTGLVVPRPIALVTTLGPGGIVNAAPYSFFNAFSEDPPLVVLGVQSKPDGTPKDTAANLRDIGSFVVNLVDEALAERMNVCAVDFPRDISEIEAAGLSLLPGVTGEVPRIAEAPAALECRHYLTLEVSAVRRLCIGQVVYVHTRAGIVDPTTLRVNIGTYQPVARLYGNFYARLGEVFTLTRLSFDEWRDRAGAGSDKPGAC
jgi:flavin reductase (DIM6/NTAB) family NADH-FMN oxidoreductase RutF